MNLLKSVETTIANLVEGTFGRIFRSEVRPMELARKLAREMDAHRTFSVSRVYVPNEYAVWLSPARPRPLSRASNRRSIDELCGYLLEHARREDLIMASQPRVTFHTDEDLALGEFGIQASLVRPPEAGEKQPVPAASGTGRARQHDDLQHLRAPAGTGRARPRPAAVLPARCSPLGGRRLLVPPEGARSGAAVTARSCSRTPASPVTMPSCARTATAGSIEDLGSTNGVLVNGRRIRGAQALQEGDRIELGSTEVVFELG